MTTKDALIHLDSAIRALTLEAYRGHDLDNMKRVYDFTIAEELRRVDSALGPRGMSMFAGLAERIIEAYVEIVAARQTLSNQGGSDRAR